MDISQRGETSGFQFLVVACTCQGERLLGMRQGARWIVPHDAYDLGQVPLRFRQRLLILTGLRHVQGFLQERARLELVVRLLDCQDRHAIQGQAGQRGQQLLLRIGQQLFIGLPGLLPGVLEGIGPPQVDIEVFDLRGGKRGLQRLVLLQQGTRSLVVPDGVCDRKDGQRLIPGLYAVASGCPGLSGGQCMIGERSGRSSFGRKPRQGALM